MVNFKENEELKTLNHSCAHLMAQAIASVPTGKNLLDRLLQRDFTMM